MYVYRHISVAVVVAVVVVVVVVVGCWLSREFVAKNLVRGHSSFTGRLQELWSTKKKRRKNNNHMYHTKDGGVLVVPLVFGHAGGGKKGKAKHDRSRQKPKRNQHQVKQSTPLHSLCDGEEVPRSEQGGSIMSVRYSRVTSGDGPSR